MPRLFRGQCEIVLGGDRELPAEQRPTFIFRAMTGLDQAQTMQLAGDFGKLPPLQGLEAVRTEILKYLVGWRHLGPASPAGGIEELPFEPARLGEYLQLDEQVELFRLMMEASRLGGEAEKKSASPSPGKADGSAIPTTAESATADSSSASRPRLATTPTAGS